MPAYDELRRRLEQKKTELGVRLERITANLRRGFEADSKERAKQLEDSEVVDALGNEARTEIAKISPSSGSAWGLYWVKPRVTPG